MLVSPFKLEQGSPLFGGLADSGTLLIARFNTVPVGIRLFVSANEVASTSGISASVRGIGTGAMIGIRESLGNVVCPITNSEGPSLIEVPLEGSIFSRSGVIVWEVNNRTTASPGQLEFAVYLEHEASPSENLPNLGAASVNGALGPLSVVTTAAGGPIPRFADMSSAKCLLRVVP